MNTSTWPLRLQGLYFLVTGLWPLLSMGTFELVTGPKTDLWLVRMVALLAIAIGVTLFTGALRRAVSLELVVLAVAAAAAFAAIDVVYALGGRIAKLYLADAVVEVFFIAAVLVTAARRAPHSEARVRPDRG